LLIQFCAVEVEKAITFFADSLDLDTIFRNDSLEFQEFLLGERFVCTSVQTQALFDEHQKILVSILDLPAKRLVLVAFLLCCHVPVLRVHREDAQPVVVFAEQVSGASMSSPDRPREELISAPSVGAAPFPVNLAGQHPVQELGFICSML